LGHQERLLIDLDLGRPTRDRLGLEITRLMVLVHVALDGVEANPESASSSTLGHPFVYRLHDPLTQVH
jgi:hypothetical protein